MNDFGTGYSSLSYLKFFPFDKLKIDKSFISGLTFNNEDNMIVEGIINMTRSMGLEVLAEGVETLNQVEFLKKFRSDQVQGYYFSKPLEEMACTKLLNAQITVSVES